VSPNPFGEGPFIPPVGPMPRPGLIPGATKLGGVGSSALGFFPPGVPQYGDTGAPPNYGGRGQAEGTRPIQMIQLNPRPSGNDFTGFPQDAFHLYAPHPVILQAQARMNPASDASLTNFFYAVPFVRRVDSDPNGNTGIGIGGQFVAVRSRNAGVMYLPPGDWYLYYPENNLLTLGVFDARDPLFASWMLGQYGQHALSRHASDFVLDDTVLAPVVALEANRWRSMVFIQNTTLPAAGVNGNVRVFTTTPPTSTRGIQLAPGAGIQFVGESLILQQIQIWREAPSPGPTVTVHASEWV
jgi:hypothetical protein